MGRKLVFLSFSFLLFFSCRNIPTDQETQNQGKSLRYSQLTKKLSKGWNTWDSRDVLTQVYLPEGFGLTILPQNGSQTFPGTTLGKIWRRNYTIIPGGHAYDGSYTDLTIEMQHKKIRVQTAAKDQDIVFLITDSNPDDSTTVSVIPGMKWDRKGSIIRNGNEIDVKTNGKNWKVFTTDTPLPAGKDSASSVLKIALGSKIGISTNQKRSLQDIEKRVAEAEKNHEQALLAFGDSVRTLYDALQSVLAWNTIYEPTNDMIITPVSRSWSGGGYVLFEWDTYFACYMLSLDNRDLAYANLLAITNEITPDGFVPNYTKDNHKSLDRSQPPVGSTVVKEVYRHYKDKWLLEELFPKLLSWNRWWAQNRDYDGYLCWGSNPVPLGPNPGRLAKIAIGQLKGAKFESGLDNSPMYDSIPFDSTKHMMMLADVGLMSMYIMDCHSLADIAGVLEKPGIQKELLDRADKYSDKLATLWNEKEGIFLNKNLKTGEPDQHKSPTLFYPLLAKVPSQEQAERMMKEHFYNPDEFWGQWIIPSISRDDPAFSNTYWRGRIWGPMNFLVYLGMQNYNLPDARHDLTRKSNQLLLKNFDPSRMVYENYNPMTGEGTSDDYYTWGALLGFMKFIDDGTVGKPGKGL